MKIRFAMILIVTIVGITETSRFRTEHITVELSRHSVARGFAFFRKERDTRKRSASVNCSTIVKLRYLLAS